MVLAPTVVLVRLQLAVGSMMVQVCEPSLTVTVPVGVPDVALTLTSTAYAWPTTVGVPDNDAAFVIVVVGAVALTVNMKVASFVAPQLSVAWIVIVCAPLGPALLIETTPAALTEIVPV
jgi:hypothetical protein